MEWVFFNIKGIKNGTDFFLKGMLIALPLLMMLLTVKNVILSRVLQVSQIN